MGREDPLKKRMATHSSILAWRIPWTEEPDGLQSRGRKELDMTEWFSHSHMQVQEDLEKDKCHTSNSGSLGDGIESKGQENFRMLLLRSSGLFEFVMTSMNDFVILKK